MNLNIPSPIIKLFDNFYIKREDLIHPMVSGNKYRKLKYNIQLALEEQRKEIVSFGGAYSNHIHALAFACQLYKIPLQLYIRGEEVSNPTIRQVRAFGAHINWLDRNTYRLRHTDEFLKTLTKKHGDALIIPEGGTNALAIKGMKELMDEIHVEFPDQGVQIMVAYGSGGTSIGMMQSIRNTDNLHIIPVLNFPNFETEIHSAAKRLNVKLKSFKAHTHYHFGGYAKFTPDLITFIVNFYKKYGIPLDPVYTGKVAFAAQDLIKKEFFNKDEPIIMIHTGGLQGIQGFNERFGMKLQNS